MGEKIPVQLKDVHDVNEFVNIFQALREILIFIAEDIVWMPNPFSGL